MNKKWLLIGCGGLLAFVIIVGLFVALSMAGTYNKLNTLNETVQAKWSEVENNYQRRLDLIPNLVETVKGAANFEKETLTQVIEARSKATQVRMNVDPRNLPNNPDQFAKFQQAQDSLGSALSRLLVVSEKYPELRATSQFRDLSAQIERTENRITVARMRYNESAQTFNTQRNSFPTVMVAGFFGSRFAEKQYFKAQAGAETAPRVNFGGGGAPTPAVGTPGR